jgi:hypothetical protein
MNKKLDEHELCEQLRRLSTRPPDKGFEARLSHSLSLAACDIRATRSSELAPRAEKPAAPRFSLALFVGRLLGSNRSPSGPLE